MDTLCSYSIVKIAIVLFVCATSELIGANIAFVLHRLRKQKQHRDVLNKKNCSCAVFGPRLIFSFAAYCSVFADLYK